MCALAFSLVLVALVGSAQAAELKVGFSPDSSAERLVVRAIARAQREILVAEYSFTNKNIAKALVDALRRGVMVRALLDKSQRGERYTAATFLAHAGTDRLDAHHHARHGEGEALSGIHGQLEVWLSSTSTRG